MEKLVDDIDYDNFKSEVARYQGASGAAYEQSLHTVWSVMSKIAERRSTSVIQPRIPFWRVYTSVRAPAKFIRPQLILAVHLELVDPSLAF